MSGYILSGALILSGIYANIILFLFFAARTARARLEERTVTAERMRPEVIDAIIAYVAGNPDLTRINGYAANHRELLEECLLQYQSAMSGTSRDRLLDLAIDLHLVQRWCDDARLKNVGRRRAALSRLAQVAAHEPSRVLAGEVLLEALDDSDQESRLEASRSLLHSGDSKVIVQIFRQAVSQPTIVRAILADDLRRYALELCEKAIPEVLEGGDQRKVLAALEIIAAWERALPLSCMAQLANSSDNAIRILALKVLALTPMSRDGAEAVIRALGDSSEPVACAAAQAATRMKLDYAMPILARCLREGRVHLAREAAAALAAMPPRGWETLEELSQNNNPVTASAAMEALEHARKSALGT